MYNSNILKTTILSLIFTFIITLSFAQDYQAERNPNESNPYSIQNSPESMWDLQFAYNLQDTLFGVGALAGVIHFDDEFWVSQWNTDSLFRFNEAGQILERFTISGLSSTRSMTFDGTYLWMGTASTTIYKVNPTTRTIVSTLTVPEKARYLTYDALGNNGGGTFWLGDWNTDIYQIDTIGDILTTIDAATHGLTGMYGAAVDNSSLGGPYLWVHWQDGSSSESEIAQLKLPNGTPTGVSFDVTTLAGASNGLAGGLFISDSIVLGQSTLGGIIQNSPNTLFGLELDFQVINYDVEMIDFSHNGQYHEIPLGRTTGLTSVAPNIFTAKVRNNGQETIDVKVNMWLECNGTTIYSDSTIFLGMANLDIQTSSMSNFPWHNRGTYIAYAKATILGNTEEVPGNNIALNTFYITDSTMARDDRQVLSNPYILNIGNTVESEIGVLYTFNQDVIVNSLEIELANPTDGAFTHAIIYRQGASTGLPDITIAESTLFVNIVAGQYVYTLPFDAPVALAAGNYIVAIHQPAGMNLGMGQSNSIFTANTNFYNIGGNWAISGVPTARMVRVHLENKGYATESQLINQLNKQISIVPNPTTGLCKIKLELESIQDLIVEILDQNGRILQSNIFNNVENDVLPLDVSAFANGVYYVRINNGEGIATKRMVKIGE